MARPCSVCDDPRVGEANSLLIQGVGFAECARRLGLGVDSVRRHKNGGHVQKALVPKDAASLSKMTLRSHEQILERAEDLYRKAEEFHARFASSVDAKDVASAINALERALRLVGDLLGSFPKLGTGSVTNNTLVLSGLTVPELKTLIAGLQRVESDALDGEYRELPA